MAIIVEDGTGKADANSYISEAELTTYATDRGITITGTNSALLYQAMDYVEQQLFIGDKLTKAQALQWPRYNAFIDGYAVPTNEVPQLLKDAVAEAALAVDAGNNPLSPIERAVKREKLDSLEIEYMDNAASDTINLAVSNKLAKLIKSGGGFRVLRA